MTLRILIVKMSAIGDVVHSLPVLAALRRMYPSARIHWLVEEAAAGLLEGHPYLDRVLLSRRKAWVAGIRRGNMRVLRDVRSFIANLRAEPYDLVIDLHNLAKSSIWVALARSPRKLGFYGTAEFASVPLTEKVGPEDFRLHAVDRYLTFISYLGGSVADPEFPVPVTAAHRQRVDELLTEAGYGRRSLAAVHPVALWATKLWNVRAFGETARRMRDELGLDVVFTGGAGDRRYMREVMNGEFPPEADFCGRLSLLESAALFERCAVAVTTDTGPMHLAAAMSTPVVALFGPTDPTRTGPYGNGHTVLRAGLSCSPCFRKRCDDIQCMDLITPDHVLEAVKDRLGGKVI